MSAFQRLSLQRGVFERNHGDSSYGAAREAFCVFLGALARNVLFLRGILKCVLRVCERYTAD